MLGAFGGCWDYVVRMDVKGTSLAFGHVSISLKKTKKVCQQKS
jgi:hypothetical protein